MGSMSTRRFGIVAVAGLAMAAACVPQGMRGADLVALEEAEQRQFLYSVYEMTQAGGHGAQVLSYDERNWMASAVPEHVPDRLMRQVGSAAGEPVYATQWSRAPHSRVYIRSTDGRWFPLQRVP